MLPINRNPSSRQLSFFGLLWLIFIAFWGFVLYRKTGNIKLAGVCWCAAILVPVLGIIIPGFLRMVYLAMVYATYPLGWIVSHIILGVIYYMVVTPIGSVMRLFGYDPMGRRFDQDATTYWTPRKNNRGMDRYFRQS